MALRWLFLVSLVFLGRSLCETYLFSNSIHTVIVLQICSFYLLSWTKSFMVVKNETLHGFFSRNVEIMRDDWVHVFNIFLLTSEAIAFTKGNDLKNLGSILENVLFCYPIFLTHFQRHSFEIAAYCMVSGVPITFLFFVWPPK